MEDTICTFQYISFNFKFDIMDLETWVFIILSLKINSNTSDILNLS